MEVEEKCSNANGLLDEDIIVISDGDEVMLNGTEIGKKEVEFDGGIELGISSCTRMKPGYQEKPTKVNRCVLSNGIELSLASSDTTDDHSDDDDFDAENSSSSVSEEESSSTMEEGGEEDREAKDNHKERNYCATAPHMQENNVDVVGVQDKKRERSKKPSNDSTVRECREGKENEEKRELRATSMKQASAQKDSDRRKVRRGFPGGQLPKKSFSSNQKYEGKDESKCTGLRKENRESNKFIGDGVDEGDTETLGEEGGSGDSMKTEQASRQGGDDIENRVRNAPSEKSGCSGIKSSMPANRNGIFKTLVDCIMDKRDTIEEEESKQPKASPSEEYLLPLKFKYGDKEPEPEEKSELDIMTDELFAEMELALNLERMGCYSHMVNNAGTNSPETETSGTTHCCGGEHNYIHDDEIGIKCLHCSHVKLEIRYVTPSFYKFAREASERKNPSAKEDCSMNGLDFEGSRPSSQDPCNRSGGTVWDIIPGIRDSMYPHQQEGFEFLWKNLAGTIHLTELERPDTSQVGGCIISHAPGTGKSRLTIIFIQTYLRLYPNCRPVVIAPANMLLTWEEEFRKWKVEFPFHNLNNLEFSGKENETSRELLSKSRCQTKDAVRLIKLFLWSKGKSILGISYNLYDKIAGEKFLKVKGKKKKEKVVLDKESEQLRKILLEYPDLVVLDEGHTPRNNRSRIWNTLLKVQTKRRIILSGTPFQNSFVELFNILHLVRPAIAEVLDKQRVFSEMTTSRAAKYCRKRLRVEGASPTCSRSKVDDHAIEKLKATISPFVHLHKGAILQDSLPGLIDCVILLNPPELQKQLIERLRGSESTWEFEHKVALASVHPSLCLHCKENFEIDQNTLEQLRLVPDQGVKTRFIMELVRLSVALKEKVLIFSQYICPLDLIKDQLKALFDWNEGQEVLQMQGKLDQKYRKNLIDTFNDVHSEAKVMLASTRCCSEGINLVGASRVVLLDVMWNPSVERQAISRAYRLGQKKLVYTYHLMTSGTTEGNKYCRQAEKDRLSELVFSSTNNDKRSQKRPAAVLNDRILEEMVGHEKLKDMFQKIIPQPKEKDLIDSFSLASLL